ncbi:MAG: outer membrane beta-barrel protein [Vicingaceae bacterium]
MKKGIIAFGFIVAFISTNAQSDSSKVIVKKGVHTNGDTNTFKWGNSKVIVISIEDDTTKKKECEPKDRWNHFAGVDLGINGFLSPANSVDLQKEGEFMDLNYAKSISVAINFMEFYIPVWQEKIGFSTGLGFEFNSYDLDRDYSIFSNKDTTVGIADETKDIEKNKFRSTMLNLPLMLETNIGKDAKHSFHLAVGGMASYRVGSKTKQIFSQNGSDHKVKNRTDFNMNPFRFSAVARIGYGDFTLFAAYSLTPIFEKDKGPELYPFTVGLSLVSF